MHDYVGWHIQPRQGTGSTGELHDVSQSSIAFEPPQ